MSRRSSVPHDALRLLSRRDRIAGLLSRVLWWHRRERPAAKPLSAPADTVSFDVYETLLFRRTGSHRSFLHLLGRRLASLGLLEGSATEFVRLREAAHREAALKAGAEGRPVGVDDLANALSGLGSIDQSLAERCIEEEIRLERELTTTVPPARTLVHGHLAPDAPRVFISDMHLPSDMIIDLLGDHDLSTPSDRCYVSCEQGATKRSGKLFEVVAAKEGLELSRHLHVGNDRVADGRAALRSGAQVLPIPDGNLNRYERMLDERSASTGGLGGVMAGASRIARLQDEVAEESVRAIRSVAAGVGGPLLTGYLIWVLRQADRRRLQRLYFLARVGEPLHELARILAPKVSPEIDLAYLVGSRQSLNLPAVANQPVLDADDIGWLLSRVENNTVRGACARLGFTPEALEGELTAAGLPRGRWDVDVSLTETDRLLEVLSAGGSRRLTHDAARSRRRDVDDYLAQIGFYDDIACGVVDLTGFGSQIRALELLRIDRGLSAPVGFHYSAVPARGLDSSHRPTELLSYDTSGPTTPIRDSSKATRVMLEVFGAATHGTTTGYQRDESGTVHPILASATSPEATAWGLPQMRQTLRDFVGSMVLESDLVDVEADVREALMRVTLAFWEHPTRAEARVWGSFPFEPAAGMDDGSAVLGRPLTWPQLLRGVRRGQLPGGPWYAWSEGAKRAAPLAMQPLVRIGERIRDRSSRSR